MLVNRIGCRNCVMLLGTVASVSCIVASLPGPFWKLVLCYGAIPGACLGPQMVCSHAAVNMYFPTKKSLAFQILLLGFGVGPLILGPAFAALIIEYTWNGALMIIAGVLFQVAAAGAVMRPLFRVNEAGAAHPKIRIDDNKNELKQIRIVTKASSGWFNYAKVNFGLELFCYPSFYVNILQYLFHVLALYCAFSFLVPLATTRKYNNNNFLFVFDYGSQDLETCFKKKTRYSDKTTVVKTRLQLITYLHLIGRK
ncbi:monocarboxylate transporter 12-like [Ciona intestinalis]